MRRIWDITQKDLLQLRRDRKTFMFLLIMPIALTLLLGYAFGGFSAAAGDARLPVGWLDQDASRLSQRLRAALSASPVLRVTDFSPRDESEVEQRVADKKLSAAIIVPPGYGRALLAAKPLPLILIGETHTNVGRSLQAEIVSAAHRLTSAAQTATIIEETLGNRAPFEYALARAHARWDTPPVAMEATLSPAAQTQKQKTGNGALAHSAPGMMLQFAIAGLMPAAQLLVAERQSRALQRLLTTATRRIQILLGHYCAMFALILGQFGVLILFGAFALRVDYLREPLAIFLLAASAASCIAALGLLIGVLARSEDQAATFSLVPMFVLSGLGGAWVPLEATGEIFQTIGHLSPVAWAMDGFKNIILRGLGLESVWISVGALLVYAGIFFALAVWRFYASEER